MIIIRHIIVFPFFIIVICWLLQLLIKSSVLASILLSARVLGCHHGLLRASIDFVFVGETAGETSCVICVRGCGKSPIEMAMVMMVVLAVNGPVEA